MYFTKFGPCDEYQKDAYFKRRTETTTSRRRSGHMCHRKVRWRSSSPLRGSPPLTWPRMAMPFDRPPASWLFAPRISDTNKWCKSTSRKRQEAELRTRIAKHLSGRVRPHDAFKHTDNRSPTTATEPRQQPLFTSTIAYKCSYIRSYIIRNESLESRLHTETPVIW